MQKRRSVAILLAMLMVMVPVMWAAPLSATPVPPPAPGGSFTTGITQSIAGVGTFVGALTVTSFKVIDGVINAVGTISGTFTPLSGPVQTITNQGITIPLAAVTGTCTILTLHTGAINLSVLGLNVSLSPIDLVITATAAPGNLLGNLLCAVVHLLDNGGALSGLTNLLNQILGAL